MKKQQQQSEFRCTNSECNERHAELVRLYAEEVKRRAIQNPPDEPPLKTVPWDVHEYTEQIPSKGELAKRTQESNYTNQKKKKN